MKKHFYLNQGCVNDVAYSDNMADLIAIIETYHDIISITSKEGKNGIVFYIDVDRASYNFTIYQR